MSSSDQNPFAEAPADHSPFARSAGDANQLDSRPIPKLGIAELMMLTFAAALLIAPTRQALQMEDMPQNFRIITVGQHLLTAAVMMIPLASLGLWVRCSIRKERYPAEPGHWLLLLLGVAALGQTAFGFLWYFVGAGQMGRTQNIETMMLTLYVIILLGYAVLSIFVAIGAVTEQRWRVAFVVLAGNYLIGAGRMAFLAFTMRSAFFNANYIWILTVVELLASFGCVGMMITILVLDLRDRKRDWLHWTGIACFLASYLVIGAWHIAIQFLI